MQALSALPGWTWHAVEDVWEGGFRALLNFVAAEGHTWVPAAFKTEDGFPLGSWVRSHRRPEGGRRTMTDAQRLRLEAVPGWTYDQATDVFWDSACSALERFVAREGHCQTPRGHLEDGINIDAWSKLQRARYHRGDLAADRASRLRALLGWSWTPQDDAWETGFAALTEHVQRTGSETIRRDELAGSYPVGAWGGSSEPATAKANFGPTGPGAWSLCPPGRGHPTPTPGSATTRR